MPVKLKIKPLIDNEVTDKNYYEDHMYTTNSMLKTFLDKCPKFFEWRMEYPIKATAPMKFGTAFHMYALEGLDVFQKNYAVEPDGVDRRTTLGKATLSSFNQTVGNRNVISFKDYKLIQDMCHELQLHNHYSLVKECNELEQIYLWENKTLKIKCKGKLDAVNTKEKYIVDLKTTRSANPKDFVDIVKEQKYHMQAAYYCDALGYKDYYIYAVEKIKPHCICVYKMSDELLQEGREMYTKAIKSFKIHSKSNEDFDYNSGQIYEI